ncbi:hypothetical protein CANTEDRAFT_93960 [Yamadazyma tenuis ATCC 10573]|uniref:PH domain-containing protein n=1 Tax=Candida tenuis (strain ATCC 10573 / BCRC 21748 / CBS 615 / JCM 9827 / NBRC 10315 / NRRL Y-1498 / VKM Y-70) TaxID=590646 RepID=G3B5D0_CANTC|nr:uncharacterized protein CANTEDRAFT_93960 [Yamadazyma tenuis ATCC 10573]EGV63189.1 hypothetical protein CANTEDRAFT_93960 [Yamadazyma tenuis ATCC 10573]
MPPMNSETASANNLPMDSLAHEGTSFRLISVTFKEAALDSPSFRASMNHLHGQLHNISSWASVLLQEAERLPKRVEEIKATMSSFSEYLLPSFADDGILDQETTVPLLKSVSHGHEVLLKTFFNLMSVDPQPVRELVSKVHTLMAKYKSQKHQFDSIQERYDQYFAVYMSASKFKQEEMAIEDSQQLFRTRKAYLHASLDLAVLLDEISTELDTHFIDIGNKIWSQAVTNEGVFGFSEVFRTTTLKIERTKSWANAYSRATKLFIQDIQAARKQIEESTIELFDPSTRPEDYDASLISQYTLNQIDEPSFEKHGYLMMKTWTKNSLKPIWVKRWAFISGGVFGMLILSPSKTFVQETDKIGVVLMNIRYAAQEDRRFCFEVRTSDQVIVLQAESLIDLKSWLKVFENEKSRVSLEDKDSTVFIVASSRFPPLITEFASTMDTVVDKQMLKTKIKNDDGRTVSSNTLSTKIKPHEKYFQKYLYYQIPSFKPPLVTSNTKTAILANSIASSAPVPSALTANLWGSVNWGVYYLYNGMAYQAETQKYPAGPSLFRAFDFNTKSSIRNNRSESYPDFLVSQDIEMKSLFESEVAPDEYCLVSFNCLWSPNANQELCSRMFITDRSVFLCNQVSGFRSLLASKIGGLVAVELRVREDHEELTVHLLNDSVVVKIYLEDGQLIYRYLQFLISNKESETPKTFNETVIGLVEISKAYQQEKSMLSLSHAPSVDDSLRTLQLKEKPASSDNLRLDYSNEYSVHYEKEYPVSAKAMCHIMLGDDSHFFLQTSALSASAVLKGPWTRLSDGKLINTFDYRFPRVFQGSGKFMGVLTIEKMVENVYYNITLEKKYFYFYGAKMSAQVRFVINASNSSNCIVHTYSAIQFFGVSPLNLPLKPALRRFQISETNKQHQWLKRVIKTLGDKGQVGKAIYLYGSISVADVQQNMEAPVCSIDVRSVVYLLVVKPLIEFIVSMKQKWLQVLAFIFGYAKEITGQRLLLAIIAVSGLLNLFLISKTSISYWTAQQAHNKALKIFNSQPIMLERAVYLKDIQELTFQDSSIGAGESQSLESFNKASFIRNVGSYVDLEQEYIDADIRESAMGLKRSFEEIGVKRHKVLMELRILNDMEKEVANAEYRNWLVSELRKCERFKKTAAANALSDLGAENVSFVEEGMKSIDEYCRGCLEDYKGLHLV